jgi:hypothetical protein
MGIVSGGAKALGSVADAIGLDWVGGVGGLTGLSTTPVVISLGVPEDYPGVAGPFPAFHNGTITLNVPNNSKEFGEIAVNMAQNSLAMVELAIALQTIVSPKGGITIKDELDPYHYEVIKAALEENNEPVPVPENPPATTLNQLGGSIIEGGLLTGLATGADAMATVSTTFDFLKITPQIGITPNVFVPGTGPPTATPAFSPIQGTVVGTFPDYALPLKIMNSAVQIQGFVTNYIVSNIRNAIDTEAGALVLKNAMSDVSKAVSDNAIRDAGQEPPAWTEPEGNPGIAG